MINKTKLRSVLSPDREMEMAQFFVDRYPTELYNNDFKTICEDLIDHPESHSFEALELYAFLFLNFDINLTGYLRAGNHLRFKSRKSYPDIDIEIDCPIIHTNSLSFHTGNVYLTKNVKTIEPFGIECGELAKYIYITDKLEKIENYGIIKLHPDDNDFIIKAEGAAPHNLKVSTKNDYHKVIYDAIKRGKN